MSKTSRITILSRFAMLAGCIGCGVWLFMFVMGVAWPLVPVLFGAVAGMGGLILFCWGFTRVVGHLLHGNDPTYQHWVKNGDPWFDTLPPPFRASDVRTGNSPFYCVKCGGDMFVEVCVCPTCGHGKDQMQCGCGTEVTQPHDHAFETVGVTCPNCGNVLRR